MGNDNERQTCCNVVLQCEGRWDEIAAKQVETFLGLEGELMRRQVSCDWSADTSPHNTHL